MHRGTFVKNHRKNRGKVGSKPGSEVEVGRHGPTAWKVLAGKKTTIRKNVNFEKG